jgi:hypothetical protein
MADQSVSVFVRELTFVLLAISACLMNIYGKMMALSINSLCINLLESVLK